MKQELKGVRTNFSKGLNLTPANLINHEEVQVAENFLFDQKAPYVREGIAIHAQVNMSLPAPVAYIKKFYNRNGSSCFTAFAGGQLYASNLSGQFVQVSSEGVSGQVEATVAGDFLYYTNYSNTVKYFDGSSVDVAGLSSPIFTLQLATFQADEQWNFVPGSVTVDKAYTHIDFGTQSLQLHDSAMLHIFSTPINMNKFAPDTSSTLDDLIEVFTVHRKKSEISSIILYFGTSGGNQFSSPYYSMDVVKTSAWVACSNDFFAMTHVLPKRFFTPANGMTDWNPINGEAIQISGSTSCAVTFGNLRMQNTPPLLTAVSTQAISTLFFGSSPTVPAVTAQTATAIPSPDDALLPSWQYQVGVLFPGGTPIPSSYGTNQQTQQAIQLQGQSITDPPLPTDTYYYKVTFTKQGPFGVDVESNPTYATSGVPVINTGTSTTSGTIWTAWNYVRLDQIPIAPAGWGVAGKKLYRRRQSESDYKFVYQIADNDTTTFLDGVPSTAIGNALEDDHWPPPEARYIFYASNQQTYFFNIVEQGIPKPSRLRWSKAYAPYYCPLENTIDIAPNDGTDGVAVFEYYNLIHCIKERSTWMIDQNAVLQMVNGHIGCVAADSLAITPNEVYWLSDEGIIRYNLSFRNITRENNRLNDIIQRLPQQYLHKAKGVYWNGFYMLAVTDQGSTENNLVICYDVNNNVFSTFPNLNVTCWTTWNGAKEGYELFFGNNSGTICQFMTGNFDISSPIFSRIKSKEFGLATPQDAVRQCYIYTKNLDGALVRTLEVTPYFDFGISGTSDFVLISGFTTPGGNVANYDLSKSVFLDTPGLGRPGPSFCSVEIITCGRYQILEFDLYGKFEELR